MDEQEVFDIGQLPAVIVGNVVDMAGGSFPIAASATTIALVIMAKQGGIPLEQVLEKVRSCYDQLRVVQIEIPPSNGEPS